MKTAIPASTRDADRFLSMRKRLLELQKIQGRMTLQEMIEAFDRSWRVLRLVRESLVERALAANPRARFDDADFYSIVTSIYDARPDDWLCGHCGASIDRTAASCPFCLGSFAERSPFGLMTISEWEHLGTKQQHPEWDFKFRGPGAGNVDALRRGSETLKARTAEKGEFPSIKPSTGKDLIGGPTGDARKPVVSGQPRKRRKQEKIAAYARKMATRSRFPFTADFLAEREPSELRTILAAIPNVPLINWTGLTPLGMQEMILRLQPDAPIGPEGWDPPPYGQLPAFLLDGGDHGR